MQFLILLARVPKHDTISYRGKQYNMLLPRHETEEKPMTAIKMSLRTFATLTLLLGLVMWIFNLALPALIYIHIIFAVIVLALAIAVLFFPVPASNIRIFQSIVVLLTICTMIAGYLQFRGLFTGLAATLTHLILALATVGLIETTLARQNRIARAARSA